MRIRDGSSDVCSSDLHQQVQTAAIRQLVGTLPFGRISDFKFFEWHGGGIACFWKQAKITPLPPPKQVDVRGRSGSQQDMSVRNWNPKISDFVGKMSVSVQNGSSAEKDQKSTRLNSSH